MRGHPPQRQSDRRTAAGWPAAVGCGPERQRRGGQHLEPRRAAPARDGWPWGPPPPAWAHRMVVTACHASDDWSPENGDRVGQHHLPGWQCRHPAWRTRSAAPPAGWSAGGSGPGRPRRGQRRRRQAPRQRRAVDGERVASHSGRGRPPAPTRTADAEGHHQGRTGPRRCPRPTARARARPRDPVPWPGPRESTASHQTEHRRTAAAGGLAATPPSRPVPPPRTPTPDVAEARPGRALVPAEAEHPGAEPGQTAGGDEARPASCRTAPWPRPTRWARLRCAGPASRNHSG